MWPTNMPDYRGNSSSVFYNIGYISLKNSLKTLFISVYVFMYVFVCVCACVCVRVCVVMHEQLFYQNWRYDARPQRCRSMIF